MERFIVGDGIFWMTWEGAENIARRRRVKTSLALTRERSRRAMELRLGRADLAELYMRGLVRFF